MAHDSTRAWPLGIGPDQTAIPGAAWLELLDGQAFPVVGAGAMVRDGNAWTPASSSNPLHVRAQALEQLIGALNATKETNPDAASASMLALLRGLIAIVGKEATLAQSVDKLNSILSRLEGKLDTTIFDSQGNPISTANRLPVEATLSGQIVDSDENAVRVKTSALAWKSWDPFGATVLVPAGTFIDSPGDVMQVNGFGTLGLMLRRVGETRVGQVVLSVYWQSVPGPRTNTRAVPEQFEVTSEQASHSVGLTLAIPTKSQYVGFRLFNSSATDATYHFHAMLRAS